MRCEAGSPHLTIVAICRTCGRTGVQARDGGACLGRHAAWAWRATIRWRAGVATFQSHGPDETFRWARSRMAMIEGAP